MSHLLRKTAASLIGATLVVASFGLTPATAEPQPRDDRPEAAQDRNPSSDRDGDADSDSSTSYTEDDDTNDGETPNNVEDDGDNQHPSGNDRSVENGDSGTQGQAESDPDDDTRGPERTNDGPDKANGSGGDDEADQDGNNGCGNDDDFEDDNEGRCTRPEAETTRSAEPEATTEAKPCPDGSMTRPCAERKSEAKGESKPATDAKPAKSTKTVAKTDTEPGNGTAEITVVAGCRTVTVTSSKDISNVAVTFADGTSTKFEGLTGNTWTRHFAQNVASATAKSATTSVTGMAGGCGTVSALIASDSLAATVAAVLDADTDVVDAGADAEATTIGGAALDALGIDCPHDADELADDESMSFLCDLMGGADHDVAHDAEGEGEVLAGAVHQVRGASAESPAGTVSARSNGALLARIPVLGDVIAGELPMTGGSALTLVAVASGLLILGVAFVRGSRRKAGTAS